MIASIWRFSEVKQILFILLLTSLCSTVINGIPITTTPREAKNSNELNETNEYLNVMIHSYPIWKRMMKYFATLNNSDLRSACISCKSLCEVASEILEGRIKPLIIRNGTISSTIDQRIFPAYGTTKDIYNDFLVLEEWQSDFTFNERNNWKSTECQLSGNAYLYTISNYCQTLIIYSTFDKFSRSFHRDAILIPKVYNASVSYFEGITCFREWTILASGWEAAMREAKLIIVSTDNIRVPMGKIYSDIRSLRKNRSISICYAISNNPSFSRESDEFSFLIFHGSKVEASTFLVETTDENELRKKLLEWKLRLDFLESHHIIAFHLTDESVKPMNSEEIFRETFGIQPITAQFCGLFRKTGVTHLNSTTKAMGYGPVYAVVGFKKF